MIKALSLIGEFLTKNIQNTTDSSYERWAKTEYGQDWQYHCNRLKLEMKERRNNHVE